jgi:hypothetical protein
MARINRRRLTAAALLALLVASCPVQPAAADEAPRLRVAVVGDSLSVGLAARLADLLPRGDIEGFGVVSSGLVRPRPCDWQDRIRRVATVRPAAVFVMLGMNDSDRPPGRSYVEAVAAFLAPLRQARIPFAVVAVPPTDDGERNNNIRDLNMVFRAVSEAFGGKFVPLPEIPRSERTRDGIHFTPDGYDHLARAVLSRLLDRQVRLADAQGAE